MQRKIFTLTVFLGVTLFQVVCGMERSDFPSDKLFALASENNQLNFLYWTTDLFRTIALIKEYAQKASYEGNFKPFESNVTSPRALAFILTNMKYITPKEQSPQTLWGGKKILRVGQKQTRSHITCTQHEQLEVHIAQALHEGVFDEELQAAVDYFRAVDCGEKLQAQIRLAAGALGILAHASHCGTIFPDIAQSYKKAMDEKKFSMNAFNFARIQELNNGKMGSALKNWLESNSVYPNDYGWVTLEDDINKITSFFVEYAAKNGHLEKNEKDDFNQGGFKTVIEFPKLPQIQGPDLEIVKKNYERIHRSVRDKTGKNLHLRSAYLCARISTSVDAFRTQMFPLLPRPEELFGEKQEFFESCDAGRVKNKKKKKAVTRVKQKRSTKIVQPKKENVYELPEQVTKKEIHLNTLDTTSPQTKSFDYSYHPRLLHWFSKLAHNRTEETIDPSKAWDLFYHTFSPVIDEKLIQNGATTLWEDSNGKKYTRYELLGIVEDIQTGAKESVVFTVSTNNQKEIYHRGIELQTSIAAYFLKNQQNKKTHIEAKETHIDLDFDDIEILKYSVRSNKLITEIIDVYNAKKLSVCTVGF